MFEGLITKRFTKFTSIFCYSKSWISKPAPPVVSRVFSQSFCSFSAHSGGVSRGNVSASVIRSASVCWFSSFHSVRWFHSPYSAFSKMSGGDPSVITEDEPWSRLPSGLKPVHYDVTLTPNFDNFTFKGEVKITLKVSADTKTIDINVADITIDDGTVKIHQGHRDLKVLAHKIHQKNELLTLSLSDNLLASEGDALLTIPYAGILNDQMKGFYRSKYKDYADQEKFLACTQFEATDARRALPCFDEPALKATFSVTLVAPPHMKALSNMPEVSVSKDETSGWLIHKFDRSPIMSTYLLAFVIGEFDVLESKTKRGTLVRTFTPPKKAKLGQFALDVGKRSLELYEEYFEINYPLPKLDQVAIPDFSAGAMENWGLVTYREVALLVDERNSSTATLQNVALVVAHENAHQWFGNLVTMDWWTDLWLNEGFATWIEHFAVDRLFPQWRIWDQYVLHDTNQTFSLDSLVSTHPIEVLVHHPDQVAEIFDTISYSKGSAVIRMLEQFLGPEPFRKGLVAYLNRYKYTNAKTDDLWNVLAQTSGKPVAEMMKAWTRQEGFPVVTIQSHQLEGKQLVLHAKQCRFMQSGPDEKSPLEWHVPIAFVSSAHDGIVGKQMLDTRESKLRLELPTAEVPHFIKLNPDQSALYRVIYPQQLTQQLRDALLNGSAYKKLSASDRLGIQNDAFSFARAGLVPLTQVLDFWKAYVNETDYTVWADIIANVNELAGVLKNAPDATYDLFKKYVQQLLNKIIHTVGWEKKADEDNLATLLRARVIGAACKYGHEATIEVATKKFVDYLTVVNNNDLAAAALPADLRAAVYGAAVNYGGLTGYNAVLKLYRSSDLAEERVRLLHSLASSSDVALLRRTLDFAFSTEVRSQDGPSLLVSVSANRFGAPLAWEKVQHEWKECVRRWGGAFGLARVAGVPATFASELRAKEVEDFFASHEHPAAERAVKQTVEKIRSNSKWLDRDLKQLHEYLQQHATSGH